MIEIKEEVFFEKKKKLPKKFVTCDDRTFCTGPATPKNHLCSLVHKSLFFRLEYAETFSQMKCIQMCGLNANAKKKVLHIVYLSLALLYCQVSSHQNTTHNLSVFGITINVLM